MTKGSVSKKRRRRRWAFAGVGVLVLSAIGYGVYARYFRPAAAVEAPALQTAKVRRGDLMITAVGRGTLVPRAEIALGFRVSGTLAELSVQVGDRVKPIRSLRGSTMPPRRSSLPKPN